MLLAYSINFLKGGGGGKRETVVQHPCVVLTGIALAHRRLPAITVGEREAAARDLINIADSKVNKFYFFSLGQEHKQ